MAFSYKFSKSGFNTIITVYQDNNQIYSNGSPTAGKELLLNEAKVALRDNYPESGNMTEGLSSSSPSSLTESDNQYISDTSWKGQTPDETHGLRQCKSGYNGPCDIIWDGYIHNYMPQNLWEQKFKTFVPDMVNGQDNTDPNKVPPPPPPPPTKEPEPLSTVEETATTPEEKIEKEYQKEVDIENKNYKDAKDAIQKRKDDNQKAIDEYKKDPFKKQKEKNQKRKESRKKAKSRTKAEKRKARKERANAVLKNAKKTLLPIVTLFLTNELAKVVSQNDKIKKLVDSTNEIITSANESNDPTKLANAKIARDTTLKIIQDNEDKITKIKKQIDNISIYINLFSVIAGILGPVLLSTPTPSPAPDVVTPPKENFRRKVYEPALKLLNGLSALLPIALTTLQKAIDILEDLKSQLLNINGQLDNAVASGVSGLSGLSGLGGGNFGSFPTEYKGFKFNIKEEIGPKAITVIGNKRHYAVAIDTNNVEVLKSELSFTLDPNDLIDQLKIIIDRENLIA